MAAVEASSSIVPSRRGRPCNVFMKDASRQTSTRLLDHNYNNNHLALDLSKFPRPLLALILTLVEHRLDYLLTPCCTIFPFLPLCTPRPNQYRRQHLQPVEPRTEHRPAAFTIAMDFRSTGPVLTPSQADAILAEPPYGLHSRPTSDGSRDIPSGYPAVLNGKSAWSGADFDHQTDFVYHLTEPELVEIRSAKDLFKAKELDGDLVSRDNFPLPTLGPKLDQLSREIYGGRGFCVVRGIKPEDYSVEDLTLIWLGVQAYIADQQGCQDDRGNMLVHIIADNSNEIKLGHHRHSTSAISFHNEESGDVISWLTRSTATAGGRCIIAPVHTIYNILAAHRPDIIRTLAKSDWPVALPHFQCRPLIFYHESKLIMNFGRTPLMGNAVHPRPEHLPKLNERQREALDMVEAIAQAVQLDIQTQAGDMHFINNFTVLHRREGFVNGAGPQEKRHLVRMRLRSSHLGWALPDDLKREWADAFESDTCKTWHVEPMPGDAFPLRKYTN